MLLSVSVQLGVMSQCLMLFWLNSRISCGGMWETIPAVQLLNSQPLPRHAWLRLQLSLSLFMFLHFSCTPFQHSFTLTLISCHPCSLYLLCGRLMARGHIYIYLCMCLCFSYFYIGLVQTHV